MFIQGYLVPVPEDKQSEYIDIAKFMGNMMMEFGALEIVEAWGDDLKAGETTDFFRAVNAEEGETVVFSWVVWPDKETAHSAHDAMMKDERMQRDWNMPFDGQRMVVGDFSSVLTFGRND